jgi:CRP/FNR family transcriptional regulator, cyclic AMP receptor protein
LEPPKPPFDLRVFLTRATSTEYRTNDSIFVQGDTANAIFYVQEGRVKLTVISPQRKEAAVAILRESDFFGEGCLAGQKVRITTAVAISECSIMKLEKAVVLRLLHEEPSFSELFLAHLLSRSIRLEEDLVAHLFHSSEKRLA